MYFFPWFFLLDDRSWSQLYWDGRWCTSTFRLPEKTPNILFGFVYFFILLENIKNKEPIELGIFRIAVLKFPQQPLMFLVHRWETSAWLFFTLLLLCSCVRSCLITLLLCLCLWNLVWSQLFNCYCCLHAWLLGWLLFLCTVVIHRMCLDNVTVLLCYCS